MAATCTAGASGQGILNATALPQTCASQDNLNHVLSIFFVSLGAFALLMVVIGGMRYVFAGGKPEDIAKARNMIIYSLIGLAMSALAAAIVNVVIGRLK